MARPLRIEMADGLYHVTVRGWERQVIVDCDRDCEDWVRLLDRVATRSHWRVFSWVLMSNHFHLFLRTPEPNLSAGMHDLNSGYASLFNRRYRRSGSLFQGRFKAILVEDTSHAWELSRYVHINPVRAKMVELPQQYGWSSYSAYRFARGGANAPAWLDWEAVLQEHSADLRNARRSYQRFVEAGIRETPKPPTASAIGGVLLGKGSWVERMRQQLADMPEDANVPQRHQLAWRPQRAEIVALVQNHFGVGSKDLQRKRHRGNNARIAAIYLIRRLTAEKVTTLAHEFGEGAFRIVGITQRVDRWA